MAQYVGAVNIVVKSSSIWDKISKLDNEQLLSLGLNKNKLDILKSLNKTEYFDYGDYIYFGADSVPVLASLVTAIKGNGVFVLASSNINVDPNINFYYYFGDILESLSFVDVSPGSDIVLTNAPFKIRNNLEFIEPNLPVEIENWIKKFDIKLSYDEVSYLKEVIPSFGDGNKGSDRIKEAKQDEEAHKKLVISRQEDIGKNQFQNRLDITHVEIMGNVTDISSGAFDGCENLRSVIFYTGAKESECFLKSIGSKAFRGCVSLESIIIPNGVKTIGAWAFDKCKSLTSIEIPHSVKSIGRDAFYRCISLKSIKIPNSVRSMGAMAFYNCASLTSVVIGEGVTSIEYETFSGCYALTDIEMPSSVSSIRGDAFSGCTSLKKINYLGTIDQWAQIDFGGYSNRLMENAKSLYINGELVTELKITTATKISDYAFYNCKLITSIAIENSVTSIGNKAFADCEALTSVVIGDSVTSIGDGAFSGCESLTSVVIPNSVTKIGSGVFSNFAPIIYNVKEGLEYLGNDTNKYLYLVGAEKESISSAIIDSNCRIIGSAAFLYCESLKNVVIPNSVINIGSAAFSCCFSLTSVAIPNSVKSIGNNAFRDCESLIKVAMGDSVRSIGNDAFYNCKLLTNIVIPDNVTSIGFGAFENCTSLTSVVIPDNVTSIGFSAFKNCTSLTSVVIGDSVTSIENETFTGCKSLIRVVIPNSVTSIGEGVFQKCKNLVIVGGIGSWAEKYARLHRMKFEGIK